ncbi:MAG: hypothetical protein ACRCZF_11835, partial [Gemmataceae bacterium]
MNRRILSAVALGWACVTLTLALAQQQPQNLHPQPRLSSVFPLGAKTGTTIELTLTGTDFDTPTALLFSHPGITAKLPPPPVDPPAPPPDPKKKETPKPKKAPPPPTQATFSVTVAADVPPGAYDVRIVGQYGVSNPRLFTVGARTEFSEKEPNNDVPTEVQKITLDSTVNGIINNNADVDYYSFEGKKGARVLAYCAAGSIDSKARPLVEIFDGAEGRRMLASNRNAIGTDA